MTGKLESVCKATGVALEKNERCRVGLYTNRGVGPCVTERAIDDIKTRGALVEANFKIHGFGVLPLIELKMPPPGPSVSRSSQNANTVFTNPETGRQVFR